MADTTISGRQTDRRLDTDNSEPTEDLQRALAQAWQALQETPSYVEQQMAQCRGFLESIAHQREKRASNDRRNHPPIGGI